MIELHPIPTERFATWHAKTMASYREDLARSGHSDEQIHAHLTEMEPQLFPGGAQRRGHIVFDIALDDVHVGQLWVGPTFEEDEFYVWDVEILEAWRGRGLGRSTMLAAERVARTEGFASIALAVADSNTIARALYESLGYETVEEEGGRRFMRKTLEDAASAVTDSARR